MGDRKEKDPTGFGCDLYEKFCSQPSSWAQVRWGIGRAPVPHRTLPTLQPGVRVSGTLCYPGAKVRVHILLMTRTRLHLGFRRAGAVLLEV